MNPWKIATFGLALTGVTAMTTGLTTAWMLRPTEPAQAAAHASAPVPVSRYAAAPAAPRTAASPTRVAAAPRVTPVATPAADCATGTERAMRIGKPGVVGALLGAGLGAAGGAIADGGSGAGKGALIGGVTGAVLGTGYGAYKTKNECGTIFGNGVAAAGSPPIVAAR